MHTDFDNDMFVCFLAISENVLFPLINDYRRPDLRSHCVVIDDVIIMQHTFLA